MEPMYLKCLAMPPSVRLSGTAAAGTALPWINAGASAAIAKATNESLIKFEAIVVD